MTFKRLLLVTLMLLGLAVVSTLVLGPVGLGLNLHSHGLVAVGLICGILSCGIAAVARSRVSAIFAIALSLMAIVSAGPVAGFMMLFGLTTGLGGLLALMASWGESGMDGVFGGSLLSLVVGAVALLGFASQAWAILRAYAECQND